MNLPKPDPTYHVHKCTLHDSPIGSNNEEAPIKLLVLSVPELPSGEAIDADSLIGYLLSKAPLGEIATNLKVTPRALNGLLAEHFGEGKPIAKRPVVTKILAPNTRPKAVISGKPVPPKTSE